MYQPLFRHLECNEGSIQMDSSHSFRMTWKRGFYMHIKGIILSALILGGSFSVLAEECPKDSPLVGELILCVDGVDEHGLPVGGCNPVPHCLSCNHSREVKTTKSNCNQCSNREFLNGLCVLKKCPDFAPVRWKDGGCHFCYEIGRDGSWMTTEVDCQKCPNTEYKNGQCIKICQDDQFRARTGECYPCQEFRRIKSFPEECIKCPNREYIEGYCITERCRDDEFISEEGFCVPCQELQGAKSSLEQCTKCPDREYKDEYCVLKECPPKMFKIKMGFCVDCRVDGAPELFEITNKECSKCPNREYVDGKCILKQERHPEF